jgi:hypothetical protein
MSIFDTIKYCISFFYFLKFFKKSIDFQIFLYIFISKSEAIHNKDYSVVKTFRAALNGVVLFFPEADHT